VRLLNGRPWTAGELLQELGPETPLAAVADAVFEVRVRVGVAGPGIGVNDPAAQRAQVLAELRIQANAGGRGRSGRWLFRGRAE
jgi:hypothetical protein